MRLLKAAPIFKVSGSCCFPLEFEQTKCTTFFFRGVCNGEKIRSKLGKRTLVPISKGEVLLSSPALPPFIQEDES